MYSRVVLLKDNGLSQGFDSLVNALAAADSNDLINLYPGAHAVASTIAAKSNVTINVLPGATVTFAEEITIAAGITNFKIVGDGNVVFTLNAFEVSGIIGSGNEVYVRGNITIGKLALYVTDGIQTQKVLFSGRNVTVAGDNVGDAHWAIAHDAAGGLNISVELNAEDLLSVPCLTVAPASGSSLTINSDRIVCTGTDQLNYCANAVIRARSLDLGSNIGMDDPDANGSAFYFEVDEIKFTKAGGGITWNGALFTLCFRKHVRVKNESTAANSKVFDGTSDPSSLSFYEGAVLFVESSGSTFGIKGDGAIRANRNVCSNKGFDTITAIGSGDLIVDADVLL